MSLFEQQQARRLALIERLGTVADLACQTPLTGELGDVAYDLLRQAAAQIASDRQQFAAASPKPTTVEASGMVPVWQEALDAQEAECRALRSFVADYIAAWEAGTGTVYLIDRAREFSASSPSSEQGRG